MLTSIRVSEGASRAAAQVELPVMSQLAGIMRFGDTAKVLAKCKPQYYRISECSR